MAKFTYYGGMALKIERSDGFKIMIDPYIHNSLCQDATPDMFYDMDVLLISHAAFDHFGETVDILRHSNATIVCGTETWARVRGEADIPESRHINVIYGDGARFGQTEVRFVPAWHGSNVVYHGAAHAYYPFGIIVKLEPGVSLYHTGDTAWRDEDGYFWYVGRTDDIIKSSGYRIGPFEIESVLVEHEAVLECAVTGVPDPVRGQLVKATVVLADGYTPSDELKKELQNYVKKETAPYKYPRVIDFVDELPKTVNGKIRRVSIREKDKK